jgi:hypothetical protein
MQHLSTNTHSPADNSFHSFSLAPTHDPPLPTGIGPSLIIDEQPFPNGSSELLYSFSQNMKPFINDEASGNISETEETLMNSQRSCITRKKYEAGIDQ